MMEEAQDGKGVFNYDFTTNLSAFTGPALFIAGELSEVQGASLQQKQFTLFSNSVLIVEPGVGHEVPWEKAAQTVRHIQLFLTAFGGTQ